MSNSVGKLSEFASDFFLRNLKIEKSRWVINKRWLYFPNLLWDLDRNHVRKEDKMILDQNLWAGVWISSETT